MQNAPSNPAPTRRHARALALCALPLVAGCSAVSATTGEAPIAILTAPAAGTAPDLSTLPWPSDLYLDEGGHINLGSVYPLQNPASAAAVIAELHNFTGFAVSGGCFFPTSAAVDQASLDGRAVIADLDADAAAGDKLFVAAQAWSRPEEKLVYLRPRWGQVLREKHRYACLLQSGVTAGGVALQGSADFVAAQASGRPAAAAAARLWDALTPLRPRTDAASLSGAVAATIFTTQPITDTLGAARDLLASTSKPGPARVGYVFAKQPAEGDAGSLEDLLGTPVANRPGTDNPGGVAHDAIAYVIQGTFDSADFIAATKATGSATAASASQLGRFHAPGGQPAPLGTATIPYTLVLPDGVALEGVPLAIFQHGLGSSRGDAMALANTLARVGVALLAIEIPFHGGRQAGATDLKHQFTGKDGPDGFYEPAIDASQLFFDIAGDRAAGISALDPIVIRGSFQQGETDLMATVQLATDGDWTALAGRDARFAKLAFKKGRILYTGESFGSILGAVVTAMAPQVGAAVLSVGGGGLINPLLTWSVYFSPIFQGLIDISLSTNVSVAPVESDFGYNLFEFLIEKGDPIAYAPYAIRRPLAGAAPRHVVMLNAYADEAVPNVANEHLAGAMGLGFGQVAAGGTPKIDYILPAPTLLSAPMSGNLTVATQPTTAVMIEFAEAGHTMITRQNGQHTHDTRARPFVKLPAPVAIANPIEPLHAILAGVASDFYAGRTPTVK